MRPLGVVLDDLAPLADRLRLLVWLRLAMAAVVTAYAVAVPEGVVRSDLLLQVTGGYVVLGLVVHLLWHRLARRGLVLIGGMLLLDGLFLATVDQLAGEVGPGRALVLLHLVAVTILASYRTGLKLALWHALLLIGSRDAYLQTLLAVPAMDRDLPGTPVERLVLTLAGYVAAAALTATVSALSERELRLRRYDLEALAALSGALESDMSEERVATLLLEHLAAAFDYRRLLVVDVQTEECVVLAATGTGAGVVGQRWLRSPDSVLSTTAKAHRTALLRSLSDSRDGTLSTYLVGARQVVVVPLFAGGQVQAVVVAERGLAPGAGIERRVVGMTERFCAQAALALGHARLLAQARLRASQDGLTGLANRRAFDVVLGAGTDGGLPVPMSLLLVDIDHFKRLNDEHGHLCGDAVLREVAQVLASCVRTVDTAARYGGEEFGLVLPGCSPAEALEVADRICAAVRSAPTQVAVTVSIGVADAPAGAPAAALIAAADGALYTAKREGRDCVRGTPRLAEAS
jgi:diguanylate cyclase (GGDEF)-like protein